MKLNSITDQLLLKLHQNLKADQKEDLLKALEEMIQEVKEETIQEVKEEMIQEVKEVMTSSREEKKPRQDPDVVDASIFVLTGFTH